MKHPGLRCVLTWAAVVLAACGSVELADRASHSPDGPPRTGSAATRITQAHFGPDARFVVCHPPACPVRTPKSVPTSTVVGGHEATPAATIAVRPAPASLPAATAATPPPAPAEAPPPLRVVLHFGFASSVLDAQAREALDLAATQLLSVRRVLIEGRTDSVGIAPVNHALARARAEAVRQHLAARHARLLAAAEVRLQSQGACCYAASNDSVSGRAANRRVEVSFERDGGDL
ncbi:OmpA family protein [Methylibium petroleiphilum]|uniref:OmpA family protein n=1 Tax=Methylibium petroleiphilum TaxID=105560 RepID=UPI001AC213C3|nr:OmpA family protein [Methylibium petroleiphilum]MBN9206107.1 OmpA family protein [Methylibium petroleiphilum]